MTLETLTRIITELQRLSFAGIISFHLMSEPLLAVKQLPGIVAFIRESLPAVRMCIDTNGDVITDYELLARLFSQGMNEVMINCYDSAEQFQARNKGLLLLRRKYPRIWYWNQWSAYPLHAGHEWQVVRLRAFYEKGYTLKNWAGHVPSSRKEPLSFPLQMFCERPFEKIHINYLGQVLLCNLDWAFEVVVGDLTTQSLEQAWNTPRMLEYRRRLLQKDRSLYLCRTCDNGVPMTVAPTFPDADRWTRFRRRAFTVRRILRRGLCRGAFDLCRKVVDRL